MSRSLSSNLPTIDDRNIVLVGDTLRIVYMIYYSEHVAEAHIQTTVSEKMQRAPQIPAPRGSTQSDSSQTFT